MPHIENRKIIKIGQTSYAVILPKSWLRFYHLKAKDKVEVESNGIVTIRPIGAQRRKMQIQEDNKIQV